MRLPRFRFTVRRMMVAVAIVGIFVGLVARHHHFASLAARYRREEVDWASVHDIYELQGRWCEAMAAKYEYPARYPWLPVAPDPPMPE